MESINHERKNQFWEDGIDKFSNILMLFMGQRFFNQVY